MCKFDQEVEIADGTTIEEEVKIQKDQGQPVQHVHTTSQEVSRFFLGAILATLVVQNSATALLMARAMQDTKGFNPQTGVIMSEATKGIVCAVWLVVGGGCTCDSLRQALTPSKEMLKTIVPALLYLCQNNLQYVAVKDLDAATFAVLYQAKILTTAVLSVMMLGKSLSGRQWFALFILFVGAALVAVSQARAKQESSDAQQKNIPAGVIAVLVATLFSGLAGVYFEKLLKGSTQSLESRNLQLAIYSLIIGLGGLCASEGNKAVGFGFFDGYTPMVWCAIFNNAVGGLLVAVIVKYADNIIKCFGTTVAIVLTVFVSSVFFGSSFGQTALLGTSCVIYSVFLYSGYCTINIDALIQLRDQYTVFIVRSIKSLQTQPDDVELGSKSIQPAE